MFSRRIRFDWSALGDPGWWHWAVTVPLLAMVLGGSDWATAIAALVCVTAAAYYFLQLRQLRPYPVQVRLVYLALLAIGMLPWMQWVHWIQLVGTTCMVAVGYCPLIRMLSLIPLNRTEPLTRSLVWRAFFCEPCSGGLLRFSGNSTSSAASGSSVANSPLKCSLNAGQF